MEIEVLQEWGAMWSVPEDCAADYSEVLTALAVQELLSERPFATPVTSDYRVGIPPLGTDECPEGYVMCGVLVRYRESS
jgi:hypothetical protein